MSPTDRNDERDPGHDERDPGHDEDRSVTGHGHQHAGHAGEDGTSAALSQRVNALVARLDRHGLTSEAEVGATLERFLAAAGPANGARLVARAWIDGDFKRRLLADASAAAAESGVDLSHWAPVRLRAVENTAQFHNVIVCTLCSCYPIALLGPSPSWYKSEAYRSRVVREPRAVLREFGCEIAADVRISVWDSTAELRYFVVPLRPPGTADFTLDQLAACVSRDALIGVALAAAPS